jgi:hypothetical protein
LIVGREDGAKEKKGNEKRQGEKRALNFKLFSVERECRFHQTWWLWGNRLWDLLVTSCETAVVTEFSDTVRV